MPACEHYTDFRSCFTCPYPDCRWNHKDGAPPKPRWEARDHCAAMLKSYRAAYLRARESGDRAEAKRLSRRVSYWKRQAERLNEETT